MTFSLTAILPLPDMLALGWFFLCWVGYAWYADHRRWGTRELASVLHEYRLRWMRRVLERENRIADTVVLQTVMRSDNLFITTTLFIIAGLISSLGAVERVQAMVSGIGFIAVSSPETLQVRILVLIPPRVAAEAEVTAMDSTAHAIPIARLRKAPTRRRQDM